MKKCLFLIITGLLLVFPQRSFCQTSGIRLSLGPATPTSHDLNKGWEMGGTGSIALDIALSDILVLRPTFQYSRFTTDEDKLISSGIKGGEVSVLEGVMNLVYRFQLESAYRPYLSTGFGYHRVSISDVDFSDAFVDFKLAKGRKETAYGSKFGAGVEYTLRETTRLFLEIDYSTSYIDGENISYAATRIGVAFVRLD
jgi:opacity protein-like surface antigen